MPTITLTTFLIVCPLVFLGGFVDAIAGGGGLISLPAYMLAGLPPHFAIATNKMSSGMGTLVSTYRFGRSGNIPWKSAIPCVAMAMIGSAAGARLALLVDADVFKIIMLVIIPFTAYYVLKTKNLDVEREPLSPGQTVLRACIAALVIGMYDGFYGPGTGTFLILLLTSFARFTLGNANGTAKAINLTTALGLVAGVFGIVGNYIGVSFFNDKGSKAVKPIMLVVLTLFFIKIITELV